LTKLEVFVSKDFANPEEHVSPKRSVIRTGVDSKSDMNRAAEKQAQGKKKAGAAELDRIVVKGAREHNLKNIDVELPKKKLIVFTGVSGSGKSSLAIDTIFAEGQRRYVESLSAYARQFIGQMEKPRYETIRGLSPTISIEQKSAGTNPRSTVGTITEIYDYLRVLYARVGVQYCHRCGKKVGRGDAESMVEQILSLPPSARLLLLAPIVENRKGEHRDRLETLGREGFQRVRIDGVVQELSNVQSLSKHKKHNIEAVVDRLVVKTDASFRKRLADSVETALALGGRQIIVHVMDREDIRMSEARSCCGFAFPELDPTLFSFNSPRGMCPDCNGLGTVLAMDEDKVVPDRNLSIRQGAVVPWKNYFGPGESRKRSWGKLKVEALERQFGLDLDTPWRKLPKKQRDLCLWGSGGVEMVINWKSKKIQGAVTTEYEGLLDGMMRRYMQTTSEAAKTLYAKFLTEGTCSSCGGRRLKRDTLHVKVEGRSIMDITAIRKPGSSSGT
jgi:excinuclease ABC subunit A